MAQKVTPETKKTKTVAPKKAAAKKAKTTAVEKPAKTAKDKVAAPKKAAAKATPVKEKASPKKAVTKTVKADKPVKAAPAKKAATKAKAAKPAKKAAIDPEQALLNAIIDGMLDKKAHNILVLDLRPTGNSVADWFVITHGTSNTQADAIADSVEDTVRRRLNEKPWHTEGFQNAEWILLDYVNVVVHVFQEPIRDFYRLEDLWADAPTIKIEESFSK